MKNLDTKIILNIPDMHEPYGHQDLLPFIETVKKKHKPTLIVIGGDETDGHGLSFHDHDPDMDSAGPELRKAKEKLHDLEAVLGKTQKLVLESNHGSLIQRRAMKSGIPKAYLKSYREFLDLPETWSWHKSLILKLPNGQPVYYTHGMKKDCDKFSEQMGMNTVQFHFHTEFKIVYKSTPEKLYWGVNSGCLINPRAPAFDYNKNQVYRPIIGVSLIVNSYPVLVPMVLGKGGRWVGSL